MKIISIKLSFAKRPIELLRRTGRRVRFQTHPIYQKSDKSVNESYLNKELDSTTRRKNL